MSDPQKFRKKPVVIEAMRLEAGSREDAAFWIGESFDGWQTCLPGHAELLRIRTLEGVMEASDGDWIIKGVAGEFYPCKPDIFATTYESVADGTTPTEPASVVGGGAELIAAERLRQVTAEGWTPEHDAEHTDGSMVRAAVCYASYGQKAAAPYPLWPWADSWWKPSDDPIKNLVRAGALIAAEIDRINGTTPTEPAPTGGPLALALAELEVTVMGGGEDDGGTPTEIIAAATKVVEAYLDITPAEPAPSGLEPGEIVAVPADLRDVAERRPPMTSNPHPDHGSLWVERNSRRSHEVARPHALMYGDVYQAPLDDEQADAIEAQLTPLPDGVYAKGDELWVAEGFPLDPAAWKYHFPYAIALRRTPTGSAPVSIAGPILVRRTPAEPPAPPTVDVPWWESVGRKLGKGPERGNVIRRCGKNGDHAWVNTHRDRHATDVPDGVNPDGTVTVQRETETDGAS